MPLVGDDSDQSPEVQLPQPRRIPEGKGWGGCGGRGLDGRGLSVAAGVPLPELAAPLFPRITFTPHSMSEPEEPALEKPPQ